MNLHKRSYKDSCKCPVVTFVKTIAGNGKNGDPIICLELQLQLQWFQLLDDILSGRV